MSDNLFYGAIGVIILGIVLFATSNKGRKEGEDWSNRLQWGYLLMMIGVFGVLAKYMSFSAVLLVFTIFTGLVWIFDKFTQKKHHKVAVPVEGENEPVEERLEHAKPQSAGHFVDYMRGFFPIILIVFVLRSFVAEPFQIPSSSMRPGLIVGDFILVNKFSYGIRLPILNTVVIPVGEVQRGDVAVFNYPMDPRINYIKRIVGVGGDIVEYRDKILTINGQKVPQEPAGTESYLEINQSGGSQSIENQVFDEKIGTHSFKTYQIPEAMPVYLTQVVSDFENRDNCQYSLDGFVCKVPEGEYFAMGDNRDNSGDSRYWGFVDDKLIVGKAFLVWMNFSDFSRIGQKIQ